MEWPREPVESLLLTQEWESRHLMGKPWPYGDGNRSPETDILEVFSAAPPAEKALGGVSQWPIVVTELHLLPWTRGPSFSVSLSPSPSLFPGITQSITSGFTSQGKSRLSWGWWKNRFVVIFVVNNRLSLWAETSLDREGEDRTGCYILQLCSPHRLTGCLLHRRRPVPLTSLEIQTFLGRKTIRDSPS